MGKITKESARRFFSKPSSYALLLALFIGASAVKSNFYIVDETEQAVITRFGKYVETVGQRRTI